MELKTYLLSQHSQRTAAVYLYEIGRYQAYLGHSGKGSNYSEVVAYLSYMRKRGDSGSSINRVLSSLKKYYDYLQQTDQRNDHPCRYIRLKDSGQKEIQLQDLLSESDLEKLVKGREEKYKSKAFRNKVIMSLFVYQALRMEELLNVLVSDIDLEKGEIKISGTAVTKARTLALDVGQIMLLHSYLSEHKNEKLIIHIKANAIAFLVKTYQKYLSNKRINPTLIRQSVIANRLQKGEDLRQVQLFSGHKRISTTERYRQSGLEALKEQILKHHPLS